MSAGTVESVLAVAADLEDRDRVLAARIAEIDALASRAASVRERALAVSAFLEALPSQLAAAEEHVTESRAALDKADVELEDARRAVSALEGNRRKQEAFEQAERELTRAEERQADASGRVERARIERAAIEDDGRGRRLEAEELIAEAPSIASEIAHVPRISASGRSAPGRSLAELEEWGGRARAALFVARGILVGERERLMVEANALGSAILGEDLAGSGVAQVKQRVEQALEARVAQGKPGS